MDTNILQKRLLTRSEAAEYLNIAVRTVDDNTANGSIAACRIGRSVRYTLADLDEFVAANVTRVSPKRRRAGHGKNSTGAKA